jgi:molybdate transport system ATP-binding protein
VSLDHTEPYVHVDLRIEFGTRSIAANLEPGVRETVALIGPNGSGKTTVLRSIAGLQPITHGNITINGHVVDQPATNTFVKPGDRRVGFVFQEHRLFPHLSALDNVAFACRARGVNKAAAHDEARTWIERFDAQQYAHQRPASLSGGQSQRIAIARALAQQPHVLLFDEPLASIDQQSKPALRAMLAEVCASFDGCVILVSHDPLDVEHLADRVITLAPNDREEAR